MRLQYESESGQQGDFRNGVRETANTSLLPFIQLRIVCGMRLGN